MERVATASLDGARARRLGACAGRDEETLSGRTKKLTLKTPPSYFLARLSPTSRAMRGQGPVLQPEPRRRIRGAVRQKLARLRRHRQPRAAMTRFGRWPPRECGHKFGHPAYEAEISGYEAPEFWLEGPVSAKPRPERGHVGGGPKGRNSGAIPRSGGRIINRKIVDANRGRCSDALAAEICLRRLS